MTKHPRILPKPQTPRRVVFVAYDDHQPLDLVGPLQVFAIANREGARPGYEIIVAGEKAGRLDAASGPSFIVDHDLKALKGADTVIVPGGPGVLRASKRAALVNALKACIDTTRRLCAVCTGAFLLAETGALNGRQATTHWRSCADLSSRFPEINVQNTPIFVHDRGVWTSAGVTAGIDMALALVEDDHGHDIAAQVARNLVVYLRRPGGQAQFSEPLSLQQPSEGRTYSALIDKVSGSLNREWNVEQLAAAAGQSVRTFHRRFTASLGHSPATAIEILRVSRARVLLETTDTSPSMIAFRCGFGSEERMRRAFRRQFGVAPGAFRAHFGKA